MIVFKRHILQNGLRLIIHEDKTTPLVSCNIVYNVGSRDENPERTGMAHLLEHYMFCGSKNIPDYDYHLQKVGAINNAYTSQDITHYYVVLPANNLETALWLESDRMLELAFLEDQLAIQKNVVIEEFKENYLNRPFGDLWSVFNSMVFEKHPYQWMPIGKEISHIEGADMKVIRDFYTRFYHPGNAVISISGNIESDTVIELVEKWFGDIPANDKVIRQYPREEKQLSAKLLEVQREIPYGMLIKGWKMCSRLDPGFYTMDLISDLFGSGQSSYLYRKFVTEDKIFTDISAYITATFDPGIFVIGGRPADGIPVEKADELLSDFLYRFSYTGSLERDLQKVKNKVESILLNNEIRLEDRSSILAVSETISRVEDFENDKDRYFAVTKEDVIQQTKQLFRESSSNTLYYKNQ